MAQSFKEHLTELLALPEEIVLDLPLITLTGDRELGIGNYKNIIEYTETQIRVNTKSGVLMVEGIGLILAQITAEYITISGNIVKIEYVR